MTNNKYGDGWSSDKLKRKDEAHYLTEYLIGKNKLERGIFHDGSFVLNVNAEWGFGKTYFLCNWADDLGTIGHPVVYFDAWQNDYSETPLIAFISTINAQLEPYFDRKIGKTRGKRVKYMLGEWYSSGKKLLSPSSPFLWGVLAKKLAGMSLEELGDLFDEYTEETQENKEEENKETDKNNELTQTVSTVVSKAAAQMLASHNSTKKTIIEFKDSLEKLTKHLDKLSTVNIPIFIFVDELDRCRPNYAIELLECIKHLFGVPGVFFIVATASKQLCHSINKVYGQEFDSPSYLKRFFDQTYTLQEPDRNSFADYLFNQYGLADRENLYSPLNPKLFEQKNTKVEAFAFMSNALGLGLRDMIQCCTIIDCICLTFNKAPVHLIYLVLLITLKEKHTTLYDKFVSQSSLSHDDVAGLSNNINITIATNTYVSDHAMSRSTMKASELIIKYINLSKTDYGVLNKNWDQHIHMKEIIVWIEDALRDEMPRSFPLGEKPNHYLSHYPKLIEQAGRLA